MLQQLIIQSRCYYVQGVFHLFTLPLFHFVSAFSVVKPKRRYGERRYIAPVHGSGTKDAITAHPIRNDSVMTAQCKQERDHYENSLSKHVIPPKYSKALRSCKKQSLE